jgi:hypothetical protein
VPGGGFGRGNLVVMLNLFQEAGLCRLNKEFISILDEFKILRKTLKKRSSTKKKKDKGIRGSSMEKDSF